MPICLVVPNPYTMMSHIPPCTFCFSVLDLKNAFFTYFLTPQLPRFLCLHMARSRPSNLHSSHKQFHFRASGITHNSAKPLLLISSLPMLNLALFSNIQMIFSCSPTYALAIQCMVILLNFLSEIQCPPPNRKELYQRSTIWVSSSAPPSIL